MKMKVDARVLMREIEVDLTAETISNIFQSRVDSMTIPQLVGLAIDAYKKKRKIPLYAEIRKGKYWEYYENNGAHYSGYESTSVLITEADRNFMEAAHTLALLTM